MASRVDEPAAQLLCAAEFRPVQVLTSDAPGQGAMRARADLVRDHPAAAAEAARKTAQDRRRRSPIRLTAGRRQPGNFGSALPKGSRSAFAPLTAEPVAFVEQPPPCFREPHGESAAPGEARSTLAADVRRRREASNHVPCDAVGATGFRRDTARAEPKTMADAVASISGRPPAW